MKLCYTLDMLHNQLPTNVHIHYNLIKSIAIKKIHTYVI